MPTGAFYGITTNPLLTARAGLVYDQIAWKNLAFIAADVGAKEMHVQVHGDTQQALKFSERIYEIGYSVGIDCVVKIPLTLEGIAMVPKIKRMGGKILLTACFDAKQMIIASALDADYIAPYFGRMLDAGIDAMAHMRAIAVMSQNGSCSPIIASVRNALQLVAIAELGHDCFTISKSVADDLFQSDLTKSAVMSFEKSLKGDTE